MVEARSAKTYRAAPAEEMLLRPLDGIVALFHRPSGQTHMVVSPVPEILEALSKSALDSGALFTHLSTHYDLGEEAEARAGLTAHLAELTALGLVAAS